jgi:ligand-binding sensor domain-containing protein
VDRILQGGERILWLGTEDGLYNCDAYSFAVHGQDLSEPHSLSHNWVMSLHQDQYGTLWAATVGRLGDDWHLGVGCNQGIAYVKQREGMERA